MKMFYLCKDTKKNLQIVIKMQEIDYNSLESVDLSESYEQLTGIRKIVVGNYHDGISYTVGQTLKIAGEPHKISYIFHDENRVKFGLLEVVIVYIEDILGREKKWNTFPMLQVLKIEHFV